MKPYWYCELCGEGKLFKTKDYATKHLKKIHAAQTESLNLEPQLTVDEDIYNDLVAAQVSQCFGERSTDLMATPSLKMVTKRGKKSVSLIICKNF